MLKLKQVRKRARMKQAILARNVEMYQSNLSNLEAGRFYPSLPYLLLIQRELGQRIDFYPENPQFTRAEAAKILGLINEMAEGIPVEVVIYFVARTLNSNMVTDKMAFIEALAKEARGEFQNGL